MVWNSKTRKQIKKEKHTGRVGNEGEQQTSKALGYCAAEKELALWPGRWFSQLSVGHKSIRTQVASFRTHIKEPGTMVFIIPLLGRWRQETCWLASLAICVCSRFSEEI